MRSFGRPAAFFIAIRSSRPAIRTSTPLHRGRDGVGAQARVATGAVGLGEHVERAVRRAERQHARVAQRAAVRDEGHVVGHAAQRRAQAGEDRPEPLEVVVVAGVGDVEILRELRRAVGDRGDAADHHEVDAAVRQRTQQRAEPEFTPLGQPPPVASFAHSRSSAYERSWRSSRSPGVSRRASRIRRLVDARRPHLRLQHERAAHRVQRPLERRHRHLVTGRLEPRDRRLRDPQPARELRLGEALGQPRLADQRTRAHRTQTISTTDDHVTTRTRAYPQPPMSDLENRTRYEPSEAEPRVFERWEASGAFHPEPTGSPQENFSIAIPPPNVTGALHMGHALNGSIQDALIRHARMQGRNTKWILGTDHAGIATQTQVERALAAQGTSKEDLGREEFLERMWEWRHQYGGTIISQSPHGRLVRLRGRALHARRPLRQRGPEGLRRAVREGPDLPRQLHGQLGPGFALGDLRPRGRGPRGHRHPVLGSTTRSRAAADRHYRHRAAGDDAGRHRDRRPSRRRALHATDGETAILPIVGRRLKIIADPYVKPEFGTGALKITPGHDPNDFEIGRAHGSTRSPSSARTGG